MSCVFMFFLPISLGRYCKLFCCIMSCNCLILSNFVQAICSFLLLFFVKIKARQRYNATLPSISYWHIPNSDTQSSKIIQFPSCNYDCGGFHVHSTCKCDLFFQHECAINLQSHQQNLQPRQTQEWKAIQKQDSVEQNIGNHKCIM